MKVSKMVICGLLLPTIVGVCTAAPVKKTTPKAKAPAAAKPATQLEQWPAKDPTLRPSMYIRLLNLTPKQVKQLQTLTTKHNAQYAAIGKSTSDGAARLKQIRSLRSAYQKALVGMLTPEQKDHFNKVSPLDVRIESLRERLGLSDKQASDLAKLMKDAASSVKRIQAAQTKGEITAEQQKAQYAEASKTLNEGVKAILTPAQYKKLNESFAHRN